MKRNVDSIIHVVMGTAGHIDHGKSLLVEKLTGIHPDRLPEERSRGLTIDLGFSRLTLRDGRRLGIIDVPGHERLIKNMVAGATGMDLVLLVVAADDGVMPQTTEHLAIIELLGIRHGLTVITKIDLVDEDLLELVLDDVRETLQGTFLETAPILPVSSVTGQGLPDLLDAIHREVERAPPRDEGGVFRMSIQRVFSAKGFGTVVTGVPLSGEVRQGDTLEIVPGGMKGRVRGIHAYGEPIDTAQAGHSTAINLSDVDYREVHRGMVLTEPGYFRPSKLVEAKLRYLPTNRRPLLHATTVRLHIGTAEALGTLYLLDRKSVQPGEETYVQFRSNEPVVTAAGDRFVVRLQSPLETIGGGEVLGLSRWRLKSGKGYVVELLKQKEQSLSDPGKRLCGVVYSAGHDALSEKELGVAAALPADEIRSLLEELVNRGDLLRASRPGLYLSPARLAEAEDRVLEEAESFFQKNRRRLYFDKLTLRQVIGGHDVFFQDLLRAMEEKGVLREEPGNRLRFRDYGPKLSPEEETLREDLLAALGDPPFAPPTPSEIAARLGKRESDVHELASLLAEEGDVVKLADDVYLHGEALGAAKEKLRAHLVEHGSMTAADARNVLGSTRKYIIPLLEHLDRSGFTIRRGDLRELRSSKPET